MSDTAVILAGAVAKGAFEAGVLQVLAQHRDRFPVSTLVGASAGALSATVYAAGIQAGKEVEAAEKIVDLWQNHAGWLDVFRPSLDAIFHLRGLGTAAPALPLLVNAVSEWPDGDQPVNLRLVLTMLAGFDGKIGEEAATTYERAMFFDASTFRTGAARERVCRTALGSAAFPGVFAPVDVPEIGPCVDGGSVNNTPIKWAIQDRKIRRVIVVTTTPLRVHPAKPFEGLELVSDFADILINERLYRDLRDAESANTALRALDKLVAEGRLDATQLAAVKSVLGWEPIEIIQVRPAQELPGTAFSGFGSEDLRKKYVEAGRNAAEKALRPIMR